MEPQASSPYRRLYGYRREEHTPSNSYTTLAPARTPAHALILAPALHPLAHQLAHPIHPLYTPLSEVGEVAYIGCHSDLYRSVKQPILLRIVTYIGRSDDQYRFVFAARRDSRGANIDRG